MRIAEIYSSVQGEGRLTGVDSVFVRASGCNLRCRFCDTPYASWDPQGNDLSIDEIAAETLRQARAVRPPIQHVVLTGGEPMLFSELIPLCDRLRAGGLHITIETAGTLYLDVACDLMSVSPKLSNSTPGPADSPGESLPASAGWRKRHEQTRVAPEVVRRLLSEYDCQLQIRGRFAR